MLKKYAFHIITAICLLSFTIFLIVLFNISQTNMEESVKSTTLPLASNEWKKVDLRGDYNSDTYVLELKHGWLVFTKMGLGGGMAFVPKQ